MVNIEMNICGSEPKISEKEQVLKLDAKDGVGAEALLSCLKPQPSLDDYHPLNAPFESD